MEKQDGTKLNTLEGNNTRPTLDRIKESLFNILQNKIQDACVLDLFAGSGALGIETLSRGAKEAIFCDSSKKAIGVIKSNLIKTNLMENATVINKDYKGCLKILSENKCRFDIIFIDPPYDADIAVKSVEQVINLNILAKEGIIIIETDEEKRELRELNLVDKVDVYDLRKYGRVKLIFLKRKEQK